MNVFYQTDSGSEMFLKDVGHELDDDIMLSNSVDKDEVLDYLKITSSSKSPTNLFDNAYLAMSNALGLTADETFLSLPKSILDDRLENIVEMLENALEDTENREYLVTYLTIQRFLRSLSRPLVDKNKLKSIVQREKHDAVKASMLSLMPDTTGQAVRTKYNMASSSTGRLVVREGPNILTMKASARPALTSRYCQGKILQIDISAAEPNIALNVCNKPIVEDVYAYIAEHVLSNRVSRESAKLIVLCALYGQSPSKLQKMLPRDINSRNVIQKCRDFFDARYLENFLESSHRNNNLRNVIGRPISLSHSDRRLLVSYYLQSSAAELSIVMFSELCKSMRNQGKALEPIYVVHDAVILDCDKSLSAELLDKKIISLQMGNWKFHAKVTEIS